MPRALLDRSHVVMVVGGAFDQRHDAIDDPFVSTQRSGHRYAVLRRGGLRPPGGGSDHVMRGVPLRMERANSRVHGRCHVPPLQGERA